MYTEIERKREEIDNEVAASAAKPSMVIRALLKMRSLYIIALLLRANSVAGRRVQQTSGHVKRRLPHGYPRGGVLVPSQYGYYGYLLCGRRRLLCGDEIRIDLCNLLQ
jgi:hypothetical protein